MPHSISDLPVRNPERNPLVSLLLILTLETPKPAVGTPEAPASAPVSAPATPGSGPVIVKHLKAKSETAPAASPAAGAHENGDASSAGATTNHHEHAAVPAAETPTKAPAEVKAEPAVAAEAGGDAAGSS
jgi:hypothetical protein